MDAKKTLKKHLKTKTWVKLVAWVLFLATLGLLVMFVVSLSGEDGDKESAAKFNPVTAEGNDYVYLDVVGISDWLYKYDGSVYYTAEDAEGYMYIVRMDEELFEAMDDQHDYWNREDENEPQPSPYRIYGLAGSVNDELEDAFCDVWDLTPLEFDNYFGDYYLREGSSPSGDRASMFFIIAIVTLCIWVAVAATTSATKRNMKKCLKRIEQLGQLENAAAELGSADALSIVKDKVILTEHFLYSKGKGVVIYLDDIVWAFKRIVKYQSFPVICTKTIKEIIPFKGGNVDGFLQILSERCPDVMFGYSFDNAKQYKQIYKANKN